MREALEPVLAAPDLAEDLPKLAPLHAEPLLDGGARRPEERVGGKLLRDRGRQRRRALLGKGGDFGGARAERVVLGLDGEREAAIVVGVFVAAIELGLWRQPRELRQRGPHRLGVAFQELPAPDREQRIADEDE